MSGAPVPAGARQPAIALTIAGSDSGGGAGIQGDLRTFARHGVFGTSVVTAITAQNTRGVRAWDAVTPSLVRAQLDAVLEDLPPAALKTGMLGTADVAAAVADALDALAPGCPRVVDPVIVASSGDRLLTGDGVAIVRDRLVAGAALVTPNLDEAGLLLGRVVRTVADQRDAARALVDGLGARAALVKGGHADGEEVVDVFFDGDWDELRHPRIRTRSTHGTGCALSAAITAHLACGVALREGVHRAVAWLQQAIATAPGLGAPDGHGPVNHLA